MASSSLDHDHWPEYQSVLAEHIYRGHDVVDTINRLLAKSPWLAEAGTALRIPKEGLVVSVESWELPRLWALIHSRQVTTDEPTLLAGAVLLLRWEEREYLIDGRRRINAWHRSAMAGPHRALVVQRGE